MKRIFLLLSFTLVALAGCGRENPAVHFARDTFVLLAKGDSTAEQKIDWDMLSLTIPGQNLAVGQEYRQMQDDKVKADFRRGLVSSFASSFQQAGGENAVSNWRIKSDDSTQSVVEATGSDANVEIGVSKSNGEMKVFSLAFVATNQR